MSGGLKVGYIRSDVIMEKYPDYRDVENTLSADNERWQSEAEAMERDIAKHESDLEELRLILSPEKRKEKEDELVESRRNLQRYRQETWYEEKSSYMKRRAELMEPVNARVNDAIWKAAESLGLDVVFDTVSGNIVYAKPALDITDAVLEELGK
jgi:outer membrane protein